jgi:hypothetical protein
MKSVKPQTLIAICLRNICTAIVPNIDHLHKALASLKQVMPTRPTPLLETTELMAKEQYHAPTLGPFNLQFWIRCLAHHTWDQIRKTGQPLVWPLTMPALIPLEEQTAHDHH